MGFREPERVFEILNKLAEPGERPPLPAKFFKELVDSPNPDMALGNFERLVRSVVSVASFYRALDVDPRACHVLMRLLGGSQFLSDILVRDPGYFYWLTESSNRLEANPSQEELLAEFETGVSTFKSTQAKRNALRRLHRRELLRLGAEDLVDDSPIEKVAEGLSDLADVCLLTVLRIVSHDVEAEYGRPGRRDGSAAEFLIVALGKLGGRELNFSSDIDLMFVYSEEGETQGGSNGSVSNQEFFSGLSERLIDALTGSSEEGFLYRVDLRLRPDGKSGALAMPLSGYESYYARRGELWERQMLIKARACAGSMALGDRFIQMVRPFVYPGYFEVSPVKEIHRIKVSIEERIGRRGEGETHLKLRPGGIRDVEFIIQCLQLLVGRIHTDARSPNTVRAIKQLQRVSALSEAEAAGLREGYLFFRRLEHRMQMMKGQSDYILPQLEHEQFPLARCLGFRKTSMYRANLSQHLETVRFVYRSIFPEEETGEGRSLGVLCDLDAGDEEALKFLHGLGFTRTEEAHRNLIFLAYGHVPRIRGTRARESFIELAPSLMIALKDAPDPDQALANLERVIAAYGAGDTVFRMLSIHGGAKNLLLSLCINSPFLVGLMVRHPGLLDWIVSPDVLYEDRTAKEMKVELETVVARVEQAGDVAVGMNAFQNRELLRIGTRDVVGLADTFETCDALTRLAEVVLEVATSYAASRCADQHGNPRDQNGDEVRWVVLGSGKLGRRELNSGSNLDLRMVYESEGRTDGPDPVNTAEFFENLARDTIQILERGTPNGTLYAVDSGYEATPFSELEQSILCEGTMERRLDFGSARPVIGKEGFAQMLVDRVSDFVVGEGLSRADIDALLTLRGDDGGEENHPGIRNAQAGLADIELLTRALQMKAGINAHSNTIEALKQLGEMEDLGQETGKVLRSAFSFLLSVEKLVRRQDKNDLARLPGDEHVLTAVSRGMGFKDSISFVGALEGHLANTRNLLGEVLSIADG